MFIKIDPDFRYSCISHDAPKVGEVYKLEEATEGSGAQSRAFHALLAEYYKSGLWSYNGSGYKGGCTLEEFKKLVKRKLGKGFEGFVYCDFVDGKLKQCRVDTYSEIPEHVRLDQDYKNYIFGLLKSWSEYTKSERTETIDALISEMHQVGVKTKHFFEILEGMSNAKSTSN